MRFTERKIGYPKCDKQGNLTKVDYIEIKNKGLAEEKLTKLEDLMEKYGFETVEDLDNFIQSCINRIKYENKKEKYL